MKLLLLLSAALLSLVEANDPKNILFIMADDLRPEAEPFRGNWGWSVSPDDTLTPNLQKLADKGTTFQNAYCQQWRIQDFPNGGALFCRKWGGAHPVFR